MVKIAFSLLGAVLLGCLAYGSKCPEQGSIAKHVVCYYEGRTPLNDINPCNCTHFVMTDAVRVTDNYTIDWNEDARKHVEEITERKPSAIRIFTVNGSGNLNPKILESEDKSLQLTNGIAEFVRRTEFNGIELNLPFTVEESIARESITSFVKGLKKRLENSAHSRVKRGGYFVSENLEDDITTAPYRTPTARSVRSNEKQETNKRASSKRGKNYRGRSRYSRKDQEEEVESRTEKRSRRMRKELREEDPGALLMVRLPTNPEVIAKKFDLKALSRYADLVVISTNNITDNSEAKYTYHPSRLMGLSDMLNADSILDFVTGMGAEKSKIVLTLPATILKFQLEDARKTTPRSGRVGDPEIIDQSQLCSLFGKGNWTVERDDDLTAPYAFSDKTWLAYEDRISVNIKAKYILLRELAGGAVYPIDADTGRDPCNDTSGDVGFLTNTLYRNMMNLERKPRDLVLQSLQQEIHDAEYAAVEAGVRLSEYRIVRVVDHTGAVHVIRKNTKTQFECSRQGYFSHPLGCNKFYRCVKFNQYTDDYTVFEYDCPAGLAFDERWEVCVWPGSLPHGAPCTGSSEIAPVPRSHYQCPNHEGYYADPENCRWFFACLDHARDGVTPLTAYEFRCPFGLVFNEQKLVCDWPWNVGACGNRGFSGVVLEHHGGSSGSLQSATFAGSSTGSGFAHSGQYTAQGGFGGGAGGTGYIAGHFDDNGDRASFATVPDYEISGGRILNRGGLILNHNINLHGVSSAAGDGLISSHARGFESSSGHVSNVESVTASPKLNLVYNPPLSSPRPFSVNVPDVEISHAYVGGSTTSSPAAVLYAGGDNSGNLNVAAVSSGGYVRDDAAFGDKVNVGIAAGHGLHHAAGVHVTTPASVHQVEIHGVKSASDGYNSGAYVSGAKELNAGGLHVTTAAPIHQVEVEGVHGVSSEYDSASFVSGGAVKDAGIHVTTASPIQHVEVQGIHTVSNGHDSASFVSGRGGKGFNVKDAGIHVTTASPIHQVEIQGVNAVSSGYESASFGKGFGVKNAGIQVTTASPIHEVEVQGIQAVNNGYNSASYIAGTKEFNSIKNAGVHVTTAAPIHHVEVQGIHTVSNAYDSSSHVTGTTADSGAVTVGKTISVAPEVYHVSTGHFTSGEESAAVARGGFSSTPAPEVHVHNAGVSETTVLVTPKPEVHSYRLSGNLHQTEVNTASGNGSVFVHQPIVEVSTIAPDYRQEFSGRYTGQQHSLSVSTSGSGFDYPNFGAKSAGNGILLEEHVERVVIPKVVSTPAPILSYEQPNVKSVVVSSTPKPTFFSAVTPATQVTVERQNFIGPITISSPATYSRQKETLRQSTPAAAVYKAPEYLPPVASGVIVQQKNHLSTPAPAVYSKPSYSFGGRFTTRFNAAKQVIQQVQTPVVEEVKVISTPSPVLFKPEIQSGIAVQKQFAKPIKFTASTPATTRFVSAGHTSVIEPVIEGVAGEGDSGLTVVQENVQTIHQAPIVETKFVSSTPSPVVFEKTEYEVKPLQQKLPIEVVQPVVSTPAPAVFKRPQYFGFGTSHGQLRTYSQAPVVETGKVVLPVSTPAPAVFRKPQYFGFGKTVKTTIQQNVPVQTFSQVPVVEDVKIVQPVVSTPAPAVFKQQEFVAVDGGHEQKSFVQENIQTYSQPQIVEDVKVVTTPAPTVYKQQEYVAVGGVNEQKSFVQHNVHIPVGLVEDVKVVQPVVSTPAPAVFKQQEYIAVGGLNEQKSFAQQNVHTFSHNPVAEDLKIVQPVVSTPAPAVFKQQEFVAVGGLNEQKSFAQQNVHTFSHNPVAEDLKIVQPVVSTPAPAVLKQQEFVAVDDDHEQKSIIQENIHTYSQAPIVEDVKIVQPVVTTPAPAVVKQEFFTPVKTVQQKYKPIIQTQFVSTPAPTPFSKAKYVSGAVDLLKSTVQDTQTLFKGPEYLPPVSGQNVQLKSKIRTYSQPEIVHEVNYVQPVVSTPAPSIVSVQNKARQEFVQAPIRAQTYNFVPSTTVAPVVYEQKQETVSVSPISVQQEIYRSRPKSKQLFSGVVQPQVSITYQQPQVNTVVYTKSTPILKSPSPTPAEILGYKTTGDHLSAISISTQKPSIYIEDVKTVNVIDQSTPKQYAYEEYLQVTTPKPTAFEESSIRVQQPIVVTEQPKKIYHEVNPVLTGFNKVVGQQETYTVSSESPVIDYVSQTGDEIDNYKNFDFQKIGKAKTGVFVQDQVRSQFYETGSGGYKINSNIQIAPPSEEYILSAAPKLVTTTVATPVETSTSYRARARPTTTTIKYTQGNDYDTDYRTNSEGRATIFSVGQVDKDEVDEENIESLLEKYSGDFGSVLGREKFVTKVVHGDDKGEFTLGNQQEGSTIGYEVSTARSKSRGRYKSKYTTDDEATASLDLKNLKLKKDKKTVIIVSQVSDANPLLIGKLAGQCSCQSNKLQIRKKVRVNGRTSTTSTTYSPEDEVTSENVLDSLAIEAITPKTSTENVILIDGSRTPLRKAYKAAAGRSRTRYDDVINNDVSQTLLSPVPAYEIAGTSGNQIRSGVTTGPAFDRYGPGGLRSFDETLQGGVDCVRPGLFRHPKYCNKFYACNYDPWKKKFTLHVFNCPIHLSYDSSISACNWPSKGPACSDDHLLI